LAKSLLLSPPASFQSVLANRLPQPARLSRFKGITQLSPRFWCYSVVRLLIWHRFPLRFLLIGSLFLLPLQEPYESSWGHAQIFHAVPPANTLVRWVNEYAFASIVPARPCPTFGRPVHLRNGSLDYGPVFLLMPFRFYLTIDTLPSKLSVWPARHYPRFRIWLPSFECPRDFNPPDLGAAKHTL